MTSTVTGGPALSDAELDDLRETVRSVCADAGGTAAVRRLPEHSPGIDAALWDTLGRQVGLAALGLPEPAGGIGGLAEIAVVCEELGRTPAPVPLLSSTVLAGQVLAGCGTADKALAELAEGAVHALAVAAPDGTWRPDAVPVAVSWQDPQRYGRPVRPARAGGGCGHPGLAGDPARGRRDDGRAVRRPQATALVNRLRSVTWPASSAAWAASSAPARWRRCAEPAP